MNLYPKNTFDKIMKQKRKGCQLQKLRGNFDSSSYQVESNTEVNQIAAQGSEMILKPHNRFTKL